MSVGLVMVLVLSTIPRCSADVLMMQRKEVKGEEVERA